MKRIYGFIVGLAVLAAPMAAMSGLASADPTTKPTDYQQVTDTVVARGLAARGIPFSWAGGGVNGPSRGTGSGANTVGFDASGLMQYAYAGAGIKLPRSSGAIYQVGQKIPPQQAQKGDMIFYGPNGTESVAMFLGNGQMLEVGDVVQVSPVRSSGMAPYVVRVLGTGPAGAVAAGTGAGPVAGPAGAGSDPVARPARPSSCRASRHRCSCCRASRHRCSRRRCSRQPGRRRHRKRRCRRRPQHSARTAGPGAADYRDNRRSSCRRCRRCSCRDSRRPRSRHPTRGR